MGCNYLYISRTCVAEGIGKLLAQKLPWRLIFIDGLYDK